MRRALPPLLLAALLLPACSDPAAIEPPLPSVTALYGPPAGAPLSPYPSDRYTTADATTATGRRVHLGPDNAADPLVTALPITVDLLNEMDGFSTAGGVVVNFSGPIDARPLVLAPELEPPLLGPIKDALEYTEPDSPLLLVDVDPASPERGKAVGIVPRYFPQEADGVLPDDYTLVAQPAVPLRPATRYLFVVTDALRAASGGEVARAEETERLLNGSDPYAEEVSLALDELDKSLGVPRERVRLATVFTTATVRAGIEAMATAARAMPPPALLSGWEIERPVQPDGRARFRAVYQAPEYRGENGKWAFAEGKPVVHEKVGLEVFLAFSDATQSGKRPVVIFGHGLGGDKDGSWGTADRLREIHALGAAVVAIDSPEHGSRAANPDQNGLLAAFNFFGIDNATGEFDIGKARDNFRQMSSDQLELVRLVNELGALDILPAGAPDGEPDLDVSRILYIGHSFGSVQGPTILAIAPEIRQAVWNVGGDSLMMLLRDSGTFGLLADAMKPPGTPDGGLARFFAVTQAIVDPGDPINYARFGAQEPLGGVNGWTPRDVLLQVVMNDTIVPNSTSEALARAMGMTSMNGLRPVSGLPEAQGPLTGNGPQGSTLVMSQFDKMEGDKLAEHGGLIFSPEARAQYVHFFQSGLAGAHGEALPPY